VTSGESFDSCPDAAILASFVEGRLDTVARERVARHVADCTQCVSIVAGTTLFLREERRRSRLSAFSRWRGIAAGIAVIISAVILWQTLGREHSLRRLRNLAAMSPARVVEGRLDGFGHAPFSERRSEERSRATLALRAEAERLTASEKPDAETLHARGVALLLTGDQDGAVRALTAATRLDSGDAAVWNDLSAAWIAAASRGAHGGFHKALSAANRAVALAPELASPQFNRGVALEHLGRRDDAARAYRAAAAAEDEPGWREEALQRLNDLAANNGR